MATVAITVRMESELKKKFEALCESFGLSLTSAFNLFAAAVVNEGRIPFEIRSRRSIEEISEALIERINVIASTNPDGKLTPHEIEILLNQYRNGTADLRA